MNQDACAFEYQLLARLQQDCEYYLGFGNKNPKHLWALDETLQIEKMREIYHGLPVKPEWLSLSKIDEYSKKMTKYINSNSADIGSGKFGYYIDLDERSCFYADVRDVNGKTIFEIRIDSDDNDDESNIFEDGYMRDKNDILGLAKYLKDLGILKNNDVILNMIDFEDQIQSESIDASKDSTNSPC